MQQISTPQSIDMFSVYAYSAKKRKYFKEPKYYDIVDAGFSGEVMKNTPD